MDFRWPVDKFDIRAGICKPRFKDDQECEDNNIILRREMSKCNEVFRYYRIADIPINMQRFLRDYKNNLSKSSFIDYMESKAIQRHRNREISGETLKKHFATLRKLKKYQPNLLFTDFDENWAQDFDNWMKRNIKSQKIKQSKNTRWSHHKVIKVYLRKAKRDQIRLTNPYEWFSISPVRGNWDAIFEEDVVNLYNYYRDECCSSNHRHILRAFLFSCMTGLRISDIKRVTRENMIDGMLVFVPYKTKKSKQNIENTFVQNGF